MSAITIDSVSKSYGATPVLNALDLEIPDGGFVSFLGPSGCGKSTLLFCIAGLEEISAGRILFDGRDITQAAARNRNIALVFQDYALYPHMTVRENLAFPLRQQKAEEPAIETQVAWAADLLGLDRSSSARLRSCPAANDSASRSGGLSFAIRQRSLWTSRSPTSTRA